MIPSIQLGMLGVSMGEIHKNVTQAISIHHTIRPKSLYSKLKVGVNKGGTTMEMREWLTSERVIWQAHRGANQECPENTMPAFFRASHAGVDMIELDVRLTKDHQLVILHDGALNRTTNGQGSVAETTLHEILQLDAGRWFSDAFAGTRVCTLDEVLQQLPAMRFNIELKTNPVHQSHLLVSRVLECIHQHGAMNRVMLSSFDHVALYQARSLSNTVTLGALYNGRLWRPFELAEALDLTCFHPNVDSLDKSFIHQAKDLGYGVAVWTVRDGDTLRMALECGVNNLIVDDLSLIFGPMGRPT